MVKISRNVFFPHRFSLEGRSHQGSCHCGSTSVSVSVSVGPAQAQPQAWPMASELEPKGLQNVDRLRECPIASSFPLGRRSMLNVDHRFHAGSSARLSNEENNVHNETTSFQQRKRLSLISQHLSSHRKNLRISSIAQTGRLSFFPLARYLSTR